jgi:methylmalonyl-CoA mutase
LLHRNIAGCTMTDLALAALFPPATRDDWLKRVEGVLKGEDFDSRLRWRTGDGTVMEPLYGQRPGPRAERAALAPWTVFQRVDHPDPAKANAQALDDLANGATGLSLVCRDAASARGFGIDPARLARVLKDVPLHAVALRVEGSGAAALHKLIASQPIDPDRLSVTDGTAVADGRPWHEQGATEGQELGATLAAAVKLLRDGAAAPAITVTLAATQDMFATLAKFRAMRLLWARVLDASGLPSTPLALHGETSWRMQATRDPHTNILRATAAVFGAGLGGADSICVLPFSLAQGLPNAFARRVARNVQILLIEECNLWRVSDPASGSGYVEQLTDDLCRVAWDVLRACETGTWPAPDPASPRGLPVIGTGKYPLPAEYPAEVEVL